MGRAARETRATAKRDWRWSRTALRAPAHEIIDGGISLALHGSRFVRSERNDAPGRQSPRRARGRSEPSPTVCVPQQSETPPRAVRPRNVRRHPERAESRLRDQGGRVDLLRRITPLACGLLASVAHTSAKPVTATAATSVTLHWTATGDDGRTGRATSYILVWSLFAITEATFNNCTVIPGVPAPRTAGSAESFTVTNLFPNVGYYFAIKAVDEVGNRSPMSNLAHYYTGSVTGVEEPTSLATAFAAPWPNPARHSARCTFVLPREGSVQVDVYDAAGRHVRSLASATRVAGSGELEWDLRDARGAPVRAGTYLLRANLLDERWVRRLVVIR